MNIQEANNAFLWGHFNIWRAFFLILFVCILFYAYDKYLLPRGYSGIEGGVVVGYSIIQGGVVQNFLLVELDSGGQIAVDIPSVKFHYRNGKKIRLLKINSPWGDDAKYKYIHYVDKET